MRWRSTLTRPVIDTSSAQTLGRVGGLILDPQTRRVTAVVVQGAERTVVPFEEIASFGKDAVTLDGADALREPEGEREEKTIDGDLDPIGKDVLDEDGDLLGTVADIEFDPGGGDVTQILLADDQLSPRRLIGVGSFAMMVRASGRSEPGADESRGEDLEEMLKSELYELAAERDIEGRSKMTKAELLQALR